MYKSTALQFGVERSASKARKEFYEMLANKAGEFIKFPITEAEEFKRTVSVQNTAILPILKKIYAKPNLSEILVIFEHLIDSFESDLDPFCTGF